MQKTCNWWARGDSVTFSDPASQANEYNSFVTLPCKPPLAAFTPTSLRIPDFVREAASLAARPSECTTCRAFLFCIWYREPDSNRHIRNGHQILSLACLPFHHRGTRCKTNGYHSATRPTITNFLKYNILSYLTTNLALDKT